MDEPSMWSQGLGLVAFLLSGYAWLKIEEVVKLYRRKRNSKKVG